MRAILGALACMLTPVAVLMLVPMGIPIAGERWTMAVGNVDQQCTIWSVAPDVLVTASHCVALPGSTYTVQYYRGVQTVDVQAVQVWDGALLGWRYVDVALLVPARSFPAHIAIASRLPQPGTEIETAGYASSLRTWTARGAVIGLQYMDALPGWVLLLDLRGGPGASGSPVVNRDRQVVGMLLGGLGGLGMAIAAPAGDLAWAVRHYRRTGPMPSP